jgi:Ca2+-transporting ATPase
MRVHRFDLLGDTTDALLQEAIALNSTAFLDEDGKVIGNPTEGALLLWMHDRQVDYAPYRANMKVVDQLTFTTERKYMATLVESRELGGRVLYVKGAPEVVRRMCGKAAQEGALTDTLTGWQNQAMRTLAFAMLSTTASTCEEAVKGGELQLMALAAISDPVRDDVPAAVTRCMKAGIEVKIVTGDTSATAREIARQIGLWDPEKDGEKNHMTGVEFEAMSDEELLERVGDLKVMSRARPLDKLRLVRLLQQRGEVVAVTGDGTNDAPALNFAQVGLSMGDGTSVAKQASDITLLDNSFASIATAVMWGRSLYRNIQRFVLFQLTINFAAVIVVLIGSIFGSELPLTVTQILWVNLIMDTFAAMALSALPPEPAVMKAKPRRAKNFIITRGMAHAITGVGALFVAVLLGLLYSFGAQQTIHELTIFFTVFVMLQFWNLFNAKAYGGNGSVFADMGRSKVFLLVLLAILAGQVLIVNLGGKVFRTEPLAIDEWGIVIGATSLIMILGEAVRWIARAAREE